MAQTEKAILDFYTYPPVGGDDWRYAFETARVRAMQSAMLTRATLRDMANAPGFEQAADLLGGTEYAIQTAGNFADVEAMLAERRADVRRLFADLMLDRPVVELIKSRDDFANLRLVLRRMLTDKPLGADYSEDGNVSPDLFDDVFEEENYDLFPPYMAEAVERAFRSAFIEGLTKIRIDLTNIRTMLRLKFTESEQQNVFLEGGYIELERFRHGLDLGYEALGPLFFVTPYHYIVDAGAAYLASDRSFLRVEQLCEMHLTGFLNTTVQITAGPQPIIAYLLLKENEIRTVRLILTAKKNSLDTKLILDRIA